MVDIELRTITWGAVVAGCRKRGRLYWRTEGSGDPVLLIMGLSFTHEMWFRVLPSVLTQERAVLFDNRGMGRSGVPRGLYGIPRMARDALAVLNAGGIDRAHIAGASMTSGCCVRVPTLVLHGREDWLIPVKNGEALARRIPAAELRVVNDAGHILTTDQPRVCNSIMLDFLTRQRG